MDGDNYELPLTDDQYAVIRAAVDAEPLTTEAADWQLAGRVADALHLFGTRGQFRVAAYIAGYRDGLMAERHRGGGMRG